MLPFLPPDPALAFAHDTILVQDQPELSLGGLPFLELGPSRAVLVRFPGLFAAAQGRRAVRASLIFALEQPGEPGSVKIGRIGSPWIEGAAGRMGGEDPLGATWAEASAKLDWKWAPAALSEAQAAATARELRLDGLEDLVNQELADPLNAWGFRLEGSSVLRLQSTEGAAGPRLKVEWEGEPNPRWASATASASGQTATLTPDVAWRTGPQTGSGGPAPFLGPAAAGDGAGLRTADGQTLHPGGAAAAVQDPAAWGPAAELINSVLIPFSRSPEAPSGPPARLRLTVSPQGLGAPPADRESQVRQLLAAALGVPAAAGLIPGGASAAPFSLGSDRRFLGLVAPTATLPDLGWSGRSAALLPPGEDSPLGRFDQRLLMKAAQGRKPAEALGEAKAESGLLIRFFDATGRSVEDGQASVFAVSESGERRLASGPVGQSGTLLLPIGEGGMKLPRGPGDAWWLRVDFEGPGGKDSIWAAATRVYDELWRGSPAPSLELRTFAGGFGVEAEDLVRTAVPEDNTGRFPAQLASLLDGRPETAVDIAGDSPWLELDLGRDVAVSRLSIDLIDLKAPRLAVQVRSTGEAPSEGLFWCLPFDPSVVFPLHGRKDGPPFEFSTGPVQARYIRILLPEGGSMRIGGVRAYGAGRATASMSSQFGPALASTSTGT